MNWPISKLKSLLHKNKPASRQSENGPRPSAWWRKFHSRGLMLSNTLVLILALSACCSPQAIVEPAKKLPAPSKELMKPPLLDNLVPPSMRPSVKP